MTQLELDALLKFFKVLADESRLKILGTLANRSCSVEELSEILKLKPPTVSHHLSKLKALGLVDMRVEGNSHVYWLDAEALRGLSKELLTAEKMAALVPESDDLYGQKVLKDFMDGERLKEIPASRKKREVVLRWLVERFEPDTRYPEAQVNEIIKRHHPDFATLRREFICHQLMQREHGVYWRV